MTNIERDEFASELRIEDEYALMQPPSEELFSENFAFFGYDPTSQVGHFLHLSALPNKYDLRQEMVVLYMPGGDEFLYAFGEGRQCTPDKPCASNLVMHCEQPFRRWRITYDATAQRFTSKAMLAGSVPLGPRVRVKFDFEMECVTPIWVTGRNVSEAILQARKHSHGSSVSSFHFEQLHKIRGRLTVDGQTFEIGGTGFRDHSRGPRDFSNFGSHQLYTSYFPSGRAFGLLRNFDRAGNELWNDAYVVENRKIRPARVLEATQLTTLDVKGVKIVIRLDLGNGEVATIEGEQGTAALLRMVFPNNSIPGVNRSENACWGPIISEGYARWTWDGESSYGYSERSSSVDRLPG